MSCVRACLITPESALTALWSAATGRRSVCLADLSAKQRRVERREKPPEVTARSRIVRLTTFDDDKSSPESGDQSPRSKGFAMRLATQLFKEAPKVRVNLVPWLRLRKILQKTVGPKPAETSH